MHASGFEFSRRLDVSHASPEVAKLLTACFDAKSSRGAKGTADYYRNPSAAHVDVPLGWAFDGWDSVYSMFSTYMPQWPGEAVSAPTRIVGGDRGAVVFFTNPAGMFGDSEIQPSFADLVARFTAAV